MIIKHLAIDEGHGYGDAGAVENTGSRRQEQALVREVGKELKKIMDENKKKYSTVSIDGGLESRAKKANSLGCDVYLSLHMNSSTNTTANGTEILVHSRGGNSELLANNVLNYLVKELGSYKRGVRIAKEYLGHHLAVLRHTTMPSILVECLFISNMNDMNKYNAKKIAVALYRGLYGEVQLNFNSGNWISDLQKELNRSYNANLNVDGIIGPKTLAACPILREKEKGNIVVLIQNRLIEKGYSCGSYGPDGSFGSGTKNALVNFQKSKNLSADGVVGKNTWNQLSK